METTPPTLLDAIFSWGFKCAFLIVPMVLVWLIFRKQKDKS